MNDDDIERRLRRALQATADAAVGDDYDLAARVPEPGRSHVMPAVAAAALVVTVTGGSAALAAVGTHHTHHKVTAQTTPATEASTSAQSQPSTVPSSAPAPTPREYYRVTPGMPYSTAASPSPTRSTDHSTPAPSTQSPSSTARTAPSAPPTPASTHAPSSTASTPSDAPSATRTKTRTSTPTHSITTDPKSASPTSTSPTTTPAPEPGAACTSAELSLDIGGDRMVGTKGADYTFMEIVNNGPTCTLDGYPTVRILDGSSATIGGPASHRSSPAPQRVTLTRNAAAEIELYDWNSSAPECTADYGAGRTLQFTPPGQSTPVTISYGYSACQLSVSAIHLPQTHPVTD